MVCSQINNNYWQLLILSVLCIWTWLNLGLNLHFSLLQEKIAIYCGQFYWQQAVLYRKWLEVACVLFFQRFCSAACLYSRILSAFLPCTYSFNKYRFTVIWQAHTAPVQQLAHTYCGVALKSSLIISVQRVSPAFVKACSIQMRLSYQRGKNQPTPLELSLRTINNIKKTKRRIAPHKECLAVMAPTRK